MAKRCILPILVLVVTWLSLAACAPAATPTSPPSIHPPQTPIIQLPNQPTTSQTPSAGVVQPPIYPTLSPSPTPSLPPLQTPAWFRDTVLYEIFPRSFYDSNGDGIGDLKGITAKLDYIKGLGVGAIWLTPIFASPSYHGYDTTDYYKIQPEFGTEDDLRELVRQAHQRNIRVLLDYVVAHTSNEHPFFKDAFGNLNSPYADWYRWTNKEHTTYESFASNDIMPTLNHDNPTVAKYLVDMAKYWMQTGIDGYRCDYVLNVPHSFWKKLRAELKAVNPDFLLLAEAWTNALSIKPYYDAEFDATFDFPVYGDIEGNQDKVGDSILLGTRAAGGMEGSMRAEGILFPPGAERVEFINNHDTNRAMSEVQGDVARAKLGALLLLTLPNTPMIYYGEEIGMSGIKGEDDKPRREPMDWYASETGAGMTNWFKPADRNNKPNDGISVEEEQSKAGSLLEYYRGLVALRNANAVLRNGVWVSVATDNDKTYAYLRADDQTRWLIVLNFGDAPASLALDLGLPNQHYTATDALTKKQFTFDGTTFNLTLDGKAGYILQLR